MAHDKAYLRAKSWSKAIRKRNIDRDTKPAHAPWPDYYDNLHEYSKNKIFCSCPMCSVKTKNKGSHRKSIWAPSYNPSISEKRKVNSMDDQVQEIENNE